MLDGLVWDPSQESYLGVSWEIESPVLPPLILQHQTDKGLSRKEGERGSHL